MKFFETPLKGAFTIELEKREDERGFFARTWDKSEFEEHGIYRIPVQMNTSFSSKKGTIRGMHYQVAPYQESKLIRCVKGAIYDVIIDLRPDSDTFEQWFGVELTEENSKMLFVPEGFAHGFVTLKDETQVIYQVSAVYNFESERIIRYDDPYFNIKWPIEVTVTSEKDRKSPDYK
jgi:dTDP-4-dehydrorhamnose 3,5-epimerase